MQKQEGISTLIVIVIIVAILAISGWLYFQFNTSMFPPHPIERLNVSNPQELVSVINDSIYAVSAPIDKYATIRWGESGTYRNKDVSAFGVNISVADRSVVELYFVKTKTILEQNGFIKNNANSVWDFTPLASSAGGFVREIIGYQKDKTICTLDISNMRDEKYSFSLECGIFDGSFEATQR